MEAEYALDFARPEDEAGWMKLVDAVRDNFPGLETEEYRRTLIKNIARRSAICVHFGAEIVGVLLFSVSQKALSCMAVHPAHRKKGLATAMAQKMLAEFPKDSEIWVTTFREGDPMGDAPRALYRSLGFQEEALVTEFGYPCQKFVFRERAT